MKTFFKGRKLAELISLVVSLVVVIGVVTFLLIQTFTAHDDKHIKLVGEIKIEETKEISGSFIVPIRIYNDSDRPVMKTKFALSSDEQKIESEILESDYLAGKSEKYFYRYFETDPRSMGLKIVPVEYELD